MSKNLSKYQIGLLVDLIANHVERLKSNDDWRNKERLGIYTTRFLEVDADKLVNVLIDLLPEDNVEGTEDVFEECCELIQQCKELILKARKSIEE